MKDFEDLRSVEGLGVQGGKKNEGELQRMARNLTVALAPDDFKPVKDLEPQVRVQPKGT